jgi:hypothetical protein
MSKEKSELLRIKILETNLQQKLQKAMENLSTEEIKNLEIEICYLQDRIQRLEK